MDHAVNLNLAELQLLRWATEVALNTILAVGSGEPASVARTEMLELHAKVADECAMRVRRENIDPDEYGPHGLIERDADLMRGLFGE